MADPDTDPPNAMDDEDLEDGEIETDEENDVVVNEVKPPAKVATELAPTATAIDQIKKSKTSEDDSKKTADAKAKGDNRKSTQDNNTKTKKSASTNEIAKGEQPFPPIYSYSIGRLICL